MIGINLNAMKKLIYLILICVLPTLMYAQTDSVQVSQDTTKSKIWSFDGGLDLYTTWIWRGQKMHSGPDMQPYVNFALSNFNIGAVGVAAWPSANYYEVDLYAYYDFKYVIPIITDYYIQLNDSVNYFDWNSSNTGHFVEVGLIVPIKDFTLSGYTFVYGADKDENGNNYFSTYLEAAYQITPTIQVLVGGTLGKGFYKQGDYTKELDVNKDDFAIVNIGLSKRFFVKKIPIDTYLYVNPEASRVYVTAVVRLFEN